MSKREYVPAPAAVVVEAMSLNAVAVWQPDTGTVPGVMKWQGSSWACMGTWTDGGGRDREPDQVAGLSHVVPLASYAGKTMTYAEHEADPGLAEFDIYHPGVVCTSLADNTSWVFTGGYAIVCAYEREVRQLVMSDSAARVALSVAPWLPPYLQDHITLRDLCRQRFKTVKAFAAAWGVSAGTASMILQGRHIMTMTHEEVLRLAELFGVSWQRVTDAQRASYQQWQATWYTGLTPERSEAQ